MSRGWWITGFALLAVSIALLAGAAWLVLYGGSDTFTVIGVALAAWNCWNIGQIVSTMIEARR